ncbi:MAG: hypothetical protein IPH18_12635 [Chitinophagaceae bacterium]|nr:hypothetical protein [Chitinophagaceae bacterium]
MIYVSLGVIVAYGNSAFDGGMSSNNKYSLLGCHAQWRWVSVMNYRLGCPFLPYSFRRLQMSKVLLRRKQLVVLLKGHIPALIAFITF